MTRNRRVKTQIETLSFLLIFFVSSMFMVFPMNNSDSETNFNEVNNILPEPIESPRPSKISSASWWDGAWRYRRLINVTYPNGDVAFTNYTTSVVFNYTEHTEGTPDYPMNGGLSDIRIVQDGVLRKYYYKKDYPNTDFVTVWFDVDLGQFPDNIDTDNIFLYFNGSTQESVDPDYFLDDTKASNNTKDAMGWIRNGDFELDGETGQKLTTEVFGWTYTNTAPVDFPGEVINEENGYYMHELTDSNDNQERTFGNWSFKWGDLGSWLESEVLPDPPDVGYDFVGTLYTYPFIVPTLGGDYDLTLDIYRNFRAYLTKDNQPMGFYIRLCEDYSSDVDVHREILLEENYIAKDDLGNTYVNDVLSPTDMYDTRNDTGSTPYTNDGEVTGKISISLDSSYMGSLLFLEIGTYGREFTTQTAFTQVDDVSFNYEINTALNDEVQEVAGSATFITKDVDGRIVPNAEVTITEEYGDPTTIGPYETSEEDGSVEFSNVAYGSYNVSVNYTIPYSGLEEVVYDSKIISTEFLIDGSGKVYELILNMSTIDFEIVDYGGYPLTYGYINVSYNKGGAALDILQLNNDGKATFRWLNRSFYYYQVYYNNSDYSLNPTPLNASYIWRDNYAKYPDGDKHQFHTLDIDNYNQAPPSGQYNIKEWIYTNDSMTQISDIKLLNVSISIRNNELLKNVSIYYIDSSNNTDTISHRIFFDDSYSGETDDDITIDLMTVVNSQLSSENRLAYGLFIDIWGVNTSQCTGEIEVNTTEALHVFNKTAISKLNIRVLGDGATISDAVVTIKSNSTILGNVVTTTLTSYKSRDSYAFSGMDLPFMYLRGYYYNFSVRWEGATIQDTFNVSGPDPDQWAPIAHVGWYNYSLIKYNFTLEFDLDMGTIDPNDYNIKFDNLTSPEGVIWGNNVSVQVFFNKTEDNWLTDSAVTVPDSIQLKVQLGSEVLFTYNMDPTGSPGNYMTEFNSSILSAGITGVFYRLVITGSKSPYTLQGDEITTLYLEGKGTVLSLHDYNTLDVITEVSQNYGELINITVKYYNESDSPLKGATITYEWLGLDPIQFNEDPINLGYYTTTIDTTLALIWGIRTIAITATLENHTMRNLLTYISITERQTLLNSTDNLIIFSKSVFALESEYFELNYTDVLSSTPISNPTQASYNLQKLDEANNPMGESKIGLLNETLDHRYILDLDTESMELGKYLVFITLHKTNYELKNALLTLTIVDRLTTLNGSSPFIPSAININFGETLNITFSYVDTLTSLDITNLDNRSYTYTSTVPSDLSGNGPLVYDTNTNLYVLDFGTASRQNGTYTIIVTLDKENYTKQTCIITLIISKQPSNYQSYLTLLSQNPLNLLTDVFWRDTVSITFNFSTTEDGGSSIYLNDSNSINLQFRDESLNPVGTTIDLINCNTSKGIYTFEFNTSEFLFIGGNTYQLDIRAGMTDYNPADPLIIAFKVLAVTTDLTIHNYTTGIEFPSYTLTEYWNETLGLTFYFRELISDAPLTNAYLTFSWAYGSGQINSDGAKGPGYYSFFFDTSNATEVGTYTITILALKQNFTNGVPSPSLVITIINRPTLLRPTGILTDYSVIFISEKIFALETEYFEFNYTDVFTSNFIKNADEASYNWEKLDGNGENGIGTLTETGDRYILDLGTASMDAGEYFILITLDKLNYESRSAVLFLIIEDRLTIINGSTGPFSINMGEALNFTFSYTDNLTDSSITNLDTLSYIYNGTASGEGSLVYDSTNEVYYLDSLAASLLNGTYTITFTLEKENYASQVVVVSLVIIFVNTDYQTFLTFISQNPSNLLTDIYWRDNVTISFNFTSQFQSKTINLANPTSISIQFLDASLDAVGSSINLISFNTSKGIYSYTFNTSHVLFIGGESYYMRISASLSTPTAWTPPEPLLIFFKVQSLLTDLTIHNYTTGTIFPSYTLTEYWNQTFGITFYFGELISSSPITGAAVTYSWAFGSGQVNPDGVKGPGYYSFFFDTGNVTETGSYIISISAVKQNFSIGLPNPNLIITIINRPTLLNTNEDALYLRREFYVLDSLNFTFDFNDALTNKSIWNADEKSFILHKRDNNGDIIPGSTILGFLHETADHQYILDLDTETLQVGEYSVIVTLRKDNHDFRVAIISLTIHVRVFSISFSTDTRINLVSGGTVQFQITLTDPNNNSVPVIGAYLTFTIKGIEYGTVTGGIIDNNDGSYTVNTLPIAEPFIAPETFIGTLIIEKANFTSESSDFTVVVQMTEILPGMPTFYFILLLVTIIGVVGSLTTYRVVQQARIPKFVKKIRKVKGSIKSKKTISEQKITRSKDEIMVKLYGDDWKELELSLEDTLGIVNSKLKPTPSEPTLLKVKKSKKGGYK